MQYKITPMHEITKPTDGATCLLNRYWVCANGVSVVSNNVGCNNPMCFPKENFANDMLEIVKSSVGEKYGALTLVFIPAAFWDYEVF